ncbi:MAG TPA: hypothetical protein VFA64_08515 [Hyphomicrobiaceae bacterium]|nr:hypothetical protein [Hyphomicrobiaceae bacterium]
MRTPKTAIVPKMPSLLTGAVVVASAVAGYAASLAWPLPAAYVAVLSPSTVAASPDVVRALDRASPAQDVAAKPPVAEASPQREQTAAAPAVEPQPAPQAPATAPVEQSGPAKAASAAEPQPASEVRTDAPDNPSVNAPAAKEHQRASGRRARRNARVAREPSAGKQAEVQFAPNPRPDQALRDFMTAKLAGN